MPLQSQRVLVVSCPRWIVEGAKTAMLFDGCGSHLYMVHDAVWSFFYINQPFLVKKDGADLYGDTLPLASSP